MTTRTLSTQAQAAKAIRAKLKATYPHTTFKVRSTSFAGGDAVHIDWQDGPTTRQVEALVHWHEAGTFDGMTDMYDYDRVHPNIPQAKYVQCQRKYAHETWRDAVAYINARYGWTLVPHPTWNSITPESDTPECNQRGWKSHSLHRFLQATPLICPNAHPVMPSDSFCPECGAPTTKPDNH